MAITRSKVSDRKSTSGSTEVFAGRNLELTVMLVISLAILVGIGLVLRAEYVQQASAAAPINLNEVENSDELLPLLGFLDDPQDRNFAAIRILVFLQERERLANLSELRSIMVTSDQVERSRSLSSFAERLRSLRQSRTGGPISFPLLTAAQVQQMRPLVSVRSTAQFDRLVLIYGAAFFAGFYVLHVWWRGGRFEGDQLLLPAVHFLAGAGFIMMLRLRDPLREALIFPDFAVGVAIGSMVAAAASLQDYGRSPLRRLTYVPLLASFVLSLVLIVFGSGPGVSDAKINLRLGPAQFQPVELIKVLLVFFLAGFFADNWEFLRELKETPGRLPRFFRGLDFPKLRYAAPLVIAVALAVTFFFLERDLGPALVMTLLFLALYAIARSRVAGALAACIAVIAAVLVGYVLKIPHTVANRVSMWLSPWDNFISPGGDHLARSFWSFSTGGLFGTGLGLGDPASVPAAHTDLILASIGEEMGFVGLVCVGLAYWVFIHRALRIARSGRGEYSVFLGLAISLIIGLQALFISAGILGLVPLSGVVTPFVNYGKSSMIANFFLLGLLASLSAYPGKPDQNEPFLKPVLWTGRALALAALLIAVQAARVQVIQADHFLGRGAVVPQADGHRRYLYNPRILDAARSIPRGAIFDRNGLPLAVNSIAQLEPYRAQYQKLRVDIDRVARPGAGRMYPFGALTFHILGDLRSRLNWGAPNTSYVERDWNTTLQGYNDRAVVVPVRDAPDGPEHLVLRRDFRELVPLVRYRYHPEQKEVRKLFSRNRDIHLSVDVRLQSRVARILETQIQAAGTKRGAAVVIDPSTGNLLASVTYPWEEVAKAAAMISQGDEIPEESKLKDSLLDRPRYGLYPPGSSFKLVTALAALQAKPGAETTTFVCKRLPDGRVGNYIRGWGMPIRDDVLDKEPHGNVDMARGLIVSCNAYFAALGTYVVGPEALLKTAGLFGISVAAPNTAARLKDALPQASYGQGQVVASPLQMARVAAAIRNNGEIMPNGVVVGATPPPAKTGLSPTQVKLLAGYMRGVVTEGTGQAANTPAIPVAGKTGTAELKNLPAHAWFVGFAPYSSGTQGIAFAVLVENGHYGGRFAAPAGGQIAAVAAELGLLK